MKQLITLASALFASCVLALTIFAGPESLPTSDKEMKEVAPVPPPCCDWTGFYVGVNLGGQFGHSEDKFLDLETNGMTETIESPWGYSESGLVGGGQAGYNYQWRWLVLGAEADVGYMNLSGSGNHPGESELSVLRGESDSDFYTTFRGRIGVAPWCNWLFYATGGGIGVNYDTKVKFDDTTDAHTQDFDWGYTVGGGIERKIGCHWSIKAEYLYYQLDTQNFNGNFEGTVFFHLNGETTGHIVRAGLNYRF